MARIQDLYAWYERDLGRFAPEKTHMQVNGSGDNFINFHIYTDNNKYTIRANEPKTSKDQSYLGCIVNSRKPRAGEDWIRGRDMPDGPFNEETWLKILVSIVSYELVKHHASEKRTNSIPSGLD